MRLPALILAAASLAPGQNTLTPKEASEGWILLFDGESPFGWTQEGKAQWDVENGALTSGGGSGWLRSNAAFADFILKCDYRTGAEGNSGLFLRSARQGAPHETGYELQIWNQHPKFPTGSLVNHIPAKKVQPAPDQWHTYEITAQGDHWAIKLDGKKVLDGRDAKSKVGHIGLQYNEGKKVEFRNIKLRPLGARPLFDGKSLAGWREVDAPKPKEKPVWIARGGAIHVEKGPGQLETDAAFDDFVLQLDIRTNPGDEKHHPNSGVFFRGEKGQFWSGYEAQIRNEYKDGDRTKPVDFGTGAIYNRQSTRKVMPNDGQYFVMTVAARGRNIDVWVDGYQVTSWEDPRPEGMNARKEARLAAGVLSLQAHDPTTNLDFRNIRLAPLPK
jgi:Domain of Unknown Function (DUF1080)